MQPNRPGVPACSRRGITLMEVLISIGILAIGLTSVLSLIPAGKAEAGKAIIYDRAAVMAMNGLSDAITFGLTRPDSFIAAVPGLATVVFDPANAITWPAVATSGTLKSAGVFARASDAATADLAVEKLFSQGRDDVVYNPPATADDLPSNGFINGIRAFEGRMTSLTAVTEADSGTPPLAPGDLATVSVVVFHNRDTTTPTVSGTLDSSGRVGLSTLPSDRTLKSIMRPGTVLYYTDPVTSRLRFAQLAMAAVDTNTQDTYVTFLGRPLPGSTVAVYVLTDSVGLAEQTVSLEGPGPFGQ
jgi:type II secretory pathway pseudopilin PulG